MISFLAPAAAGNAAQLLLMPPAGSRHWRVLRKRTDEFSGPDDASANLVYEGDEKFFIDRLALVNGTTYFYKPFYWNGSAWLYAGSRSLVPAASFRDLSVDPAEIVRERLDLGFAVYLERGELQHEIDHIPVLMQTPAYEDAVFPMCTLLVPNQSPTERFIGEVLGEEFFDEETGEVSSTEGWLDRYQLSITVWTKNGDTRAAMRRALKAVVVANLPVFESAGLSQIEVSYSDADDMETYTAPVYTTTCTLTCVAPTVVESSLPAVLSTTTTLIL